MIDALTSLLCLLPIALFGFTWSAWHNKRRFTETRIYPVGAMIEKDGSYCFPDERGRWRRWPDPLPR